MAENRYRYCPNCGACLEPGCRYCSNCGRPVVGGPGPDDPYSIHSGNGEPEQSPLDTFLDEGPGDHPYRAPYQPPPYECGGACYPADIRQEPKGKAKPMDSTFLIGSLMVTGYAVLSLVGGMYLMSNAGYMADTMELEADLFGYSFEYYYGLSKAEYISFTQFLGMIAISTAILAALSAFLCYIRRYRMAAVTLCGLASLGVMLAGFDTSSVFCMLTGLVATFLIYNNTEDYFVD